MPRRIRDLPPVALTAWCATLVLCERGALLYAALEARSSHVETATIAAAGASALFLLRTASQHELRSALELSVMRRFSSAVLRGPVLEGSDEDLQRGYFDALEAVKTAFGLALPSLLGDGAALLVAGVALYVTQPIGRIAVTAAALGAAGLLMLLLRRTTSATQTRMFEANQRAYRELLAIVSGRVNIAGSGATPRRLASLDTAGLEWRVRARRAALGTSLAGRLPSAIVLGTVLGLIAWQGHAPPGDLAVIAAALVPVGALAVAVASWTRVSASLRALEGVLARDVHTGGAGPVPASTAVHLDKVSATYTDIDHQALAAIDLHLDGPSLVAIAGPNGSGKSTLLRLLVGLVAPSSGHVLIGDTDLAALDLDAWRRSVSFLPQRPFLQSGTSVREAMSYLDDVTDTAARAALERTGGWVVLASKNAKEPLAVSVDELSGGERQRVALARAMTREARIYLLDEPEASLDREGLRHAAQVLRELAKTSLVIVAAHGDELLEAADRVIQLEGGRIVSDTRRTVPFTAPTSS